MKASTVAAGAGLVLIGFVTGWVANDQKSDSSGPGYGNLGERTECFSPEEGMTVEEISDVLGPPINESPVEDLEGRPGELVSWPEGNVEFIDGQATYWFLSGEIIC